MIVFIEREIKEKKFGEKEIKKTNRKRNKWEGVKRKKKFKEKRN